MVCDPARRRSPEPRTPLRSCAGSHGGAAAPPYPVTVGLTCVPSRSLAKAGRSAQMVANQRSAVRNSGPLETCEPALPPHPGPLPWGEGDRQRQPSFQAGPIDVRARSQAVPSPRGEGQGEGDRSAFVAQPRSNCPSSGRARIPVPPSGEPSAPPSARWRLERPQRLLRYQRPDGPRGATVPTINEAPGV